MKWNIFFILFCFVSSIVNAQLSVCVTDSTTQKKINNAIITLYTGDNIIFFCTTNETGCCFIEDNYLVNFDSIVINNLDYKSKFIPKSFIESKNWIEVKLSSLYKDLKEVVVRSKKQRIVKIQGDTASFKVADLKQPYDKTIEDVIARIPGVSVDKNGTISYNNKQIAGLTVDNDDILGSKYVMGSRNITPEIIDSIDVQDNTQKIRTLINIVPSQAVYLNLRTSKNVKIKPFGNIKIGTGYDKGEVKAILFVLKQRIKHITNVTANNTIAKSLEEFEDIELENVENQEIINSKPSPFFTSISNANSNQDLDALSNNSFGFGSTSLKKIKAHSNLLFQLFGTSNVLVNKNDFFNSFNLPSGSIAFNEFELNKDKTYNINTLLKYEVNSYKFYIKNILFLQKKSKTNQSNIASSSALNNLLNFDFANLYFINSLVKPFSEDFIFKADVAQQFQNGINTSNLMSSERLRLYNYLDSTSFGFNNKLNSKTFNSNNKICILYNSFLNLQYTLKFNYKSVSGNSFENSLDSNQKILSNKLKNLSNYSIGNFCNELSLNKKINDFTFYSSFGVNQFNRIIEDFLKTDKEIYKKNFGFYNVRLGYKFWRESSLNFNVSRDADIPNFDELFIINPLLKNYRTVINNYISGLVSDKTDIGIHFKYVKSVKLFFVNFGFSREIQNNSYLHNNNLGLNFSSIFLQNYNNFNQSNNYYIQLSKFWFKIKSRFTLSYNYKEGNSNQLQNNVINDWFTKQQTIKLIFQRKISTWLDIEMKNQVSIVNNNPIRNNLAKNTKTISYNNELVLGGGFKKFDYKFNVSNTVLYFNNKLNSDFFLANASLNYQKNDNLTYYIYFTNLFNSSNFSTIENNSEIQQVYNLHLRPLQGLLGLKFNF